MSKLDFSQKINRMFFKNNSPSQVKLDIKIEDYKYNSNNEGFHLSYLVQVDYKDTLPPTSPNALIDFNLSNDIQTSSLSEVGYSQV